ncbi:MAG: immunoglobulin domain-containing protein, partial [Clostridia bacterium]|nr:immunoglobulin domain-containing protein [Clostridia bacterium]
VKLVPPVITGQPANVSVRNGKNANLTIKAKGAKKYQWQVNDGSGWTDIPKTTKNKLTLKKVTFDMNGNLYRCVAINADGEVTSEVATLTVYLVPPTVTAEPKDATVKAGKTASFSVKAKEAKRYQWQVNDGSGWVDIPKATRNKLTVKKVIAADDGKQYRCILTNGDGSTPSHTATLSVTE